MMSAVPARVSEALSVGSSPLPEQEVGQEKACWGWASMATSAAGLKLLLSIAHFF